MSTTTRPDHGRFGRFMTLAAVALAVMLGAGLPAEAQNRSPEYNQRVMNEFERAFKDANDRAERRDDRKDRRREESREERRYREAARARKVLPARCAADIQISMGNDRRASRSTVYHARCLRDRNVNIRDMPRRCETTYTHRGERSRVFEKNCLLRAGYVTEQRRRR